MAAENRELELAADAAPAPAGTIASDAFAPPEAATDDEPVDFRAGEPPAGERVAPAPSAPAAASAVLPGAHAEAPGRPPPLVTAGRWLVVPRHRFAVGCAVALLFGFLVANLYKSAQWSSAVAESNRTLRAEYADTTDVESWRALDDVRASEREVLTARRFHIGVTASLLWLAVAGGVGYVWFRRVDWDAVARRVDASSE
jgi:hypothetical protein